MLTGRDTRGAQLTAGALVAVVAALMITVLSGGLERGSVDDRVSKAAHHQALAHHGVLTAARDVTQLGGPVIVDVLAAIIVVALFVERRRGDACFVAAVRLITWLLSSLLKGAVDRSRPHFAVAFGHWGNGSFPSGHAAGAASVYLPLTALLIASLPRPAARATAATGGVLLCLAVAASRVVLGAHYPSDVIAGLALGAAVTVLLWPMTNRSFGLATGRS